jgi:hypothetical protein
MANAGWRSSLSRFFPYVSKTCVYRSGKKSEPGFVRGNAARGWKLSKAHFGAIGSLWFETPSVRPSAVPMSSSAVSTHCSCGQASPRFHRMKCSDCRCSAFTRTVREFCNLRTTVFCSSCFSVDCCFTVDASQTSMTFATMIKKRSP